MVFVWKNNCNFAGIFFEKYLMKTLFLNIVVRTWQLMMSTSATWEGILEDNKDRNVFKSYFLPFLLVLVVAAGFFGAVYAGSGAVKNGVVHAIITFVAYISAYFLTGYMARNYISKRFPEKFDELKIQKLVTFSFSVVFVIKLITIIVPGLFFLQILNIYTIYIVWEGCRIIFDMDEDERGKIMLIVGVAIMLMPGIMNKIILMLMPGF